MTLLRTGPKALQGVCGKSLTHLNMSARDMPPETCSKLAKAAAPAVRLALRSALLKGSWGQLLEKLRPASETLEALWEFGLRVGSRAMARLSGNRHTCTQISSL